jgi:hypothetical protein
MKNKLYIFTAILVSLFSLTSCGLEEPYTPEKNPDAVIEFVGRPVGFNNQDVDTKSEPNGEYDNKVCNCYFLLFDASTGGILYRTGGDAESLQNFRIPKTELSAKGITSVTACYLVNVPKTFAEGLKYLEKTSSAASGTNPGDNECLSTAVIDIPSYQSGTPMGVPVIDGKAGIPMYGKATFSLEGNTNTEICQIPVKRLFAKITVDISLALSLEGWGEQIIQSATYYKLDKYTLHNLPKKVCLEEKIQETESAWAGVKSSFAYTDAGSNPSGSLNQSIVYNNNGNYSFSFYVPEYYLNASTEADENQKNKPKNYRAGGLPVYITLHGSYIEYTYRSAKMQHKIYLGRDSHSDFSFARNTHYTNYLTINGVSGNENGEGSNLDWRVVADVIHNPVEVEGKSANCYIIKDAGDYSFPAYKGAYNELKEAKFCSGNDKSQVVLVARDNNNIQLSNMKYDAASNFISFTVIKIADGNAVIALQNEDESIEWSWHLWCSTSSVIGDWFQNMTNITGAWGDMSFQTYPNGSKMMDRNLGASAQGAEGLYYQYGSKKPYIGSTYVGGGINGTDTWYATETYTKPDNTEDTRYVKTINDPCPPGYRMPGPNEWDPSKGTGATTDYLFSYLISPAVGFLYTGYLDSTNNNKEKNEDTSTQDVVDAGTYTIPDYTGESNPVMGSQSSKVEYRTITRTKKEYINIQYNVPTTQKLGGFWTADSGKAFRYYNYRADWTEFNILDPYGFINIVGCKYRTYVCTVQQKREKVLLWWGDWKDISGTETPISDSSESVDASVINTRNNKGDLALNQYRVTTVGQSNTQVISSNVKNGFQVRCIKE